MTFLEVFPFTQVIDVFLAAAGLADALADADGVAAGSTA